MTSLKKSVAKKGNKGDHEEIRNKHKTKCTDLSGNENKFFQLVL